MLMNEANQTMRFSEFLIDQVSGIITPELFRADRIYHGGVLCIRYPPDTGSFR